MDSFRVLGAGKVACLDLGGSGNETRAHLAADRRITGMFRAFDNPAHALARFHAQPGPAERLAKVATRDRSIDGLPVGVQTVMPAFDTPAR